MPPPPQLKLLMIGADSPLTYLIARYAERGGCQITALKAAPSIDDVRSMNPLAIIFPTIESLRAAHRLIADLANGDIPVLVCSPAADQFQARELGADQCLLHPLTYDSFMAALIQGGTPGSTEGCNSASSWSRADDPILHGN